MPRIGEQTTQNGRILEWQGDMWIDVGEVNIPPGVRVGSVADLRPGIDFHGSGPNVQWEKTGGNITAPRIKRQHTDPYNPDLGAMYSSRRLNPDTMQYGPLTQSETPIGRGQSSFADPTSYEQRVQNRRDAMPKGSIADLRPGVDFQGAGPNVQWEKTGGNITAPRIRRQHLDPHNPDLGYMYSSRPLNPDTGTYGPLRQSADPIGRGGIPHADPKSFEQRQATPFETARNTKQIVDSVRRDVGPELAEDGGYRMDDPNIANLSYFNPEEDILETARIKIQNVINNAFGTEKRAGPDTHAELSRTINRIADTAGLPQSEIMQFQKSLTENYATNLKATKEQVGATAIDAIDEDFYIAGDFSAGDQTADWLAKLKEWTLDKENYMEKLIEGQFLGDKSKILKKGDVPEEFYSAGDQAAIDEIDEYWNKKKEDIEKIVKKTIIKYGDISLHQLTTMAEDGELPPVPESLFYALANPTIKVERQIENPDYDPTELHGPQNPIFITTIDEIANPILEPIFNIYASQLDSQVEAFRLKKADDMSAAENASRINQALISATGGLAGRGEEDYTQEDLAKQEKSLARIAATGGLDGLDADDYKTYLTNKALIAATGGLRGGDEGLSANELAEKQKAQQQISATGGLSGFTPFLDAAMADFAAPIQSQLFGTQDGSIATTTYQTPFEKQKAQLFGTQDGSIATTRSLTPFELAQLQLEPERIRATNEAAQRTQLEDQFSRDLALRQQEMDARYGGTDAIGLEQGRLNLETRRQQEAESARIYDQQMRTGEADMVRAQIAEDNRRQLEDEQMRNLNYQAQFGGIGTMGLDVRRQQEAEAARQFAQQQQTGQRTFAEQQQVGERAFAEQQQQSDAVEQQRRFNENLAINQRAQELSENQLAQQRSLELANLYADPNRVGALSALYGPDIFQTQNPFGAPTTSSTTQPTGMSQNLGYTPFGSSTLTTGHYQDLSPFAQSSYLTTQARQRGKSVEELMDEMQSVTPMGTNGGAGGLGGSLASTGELY